MGSMKNLATVMPATADSPKCPSKMPEEEEQPYGALLGTAHPQSYVKEPVENGTPPKAKHVSSPGLSGKSPVISEVSKKGSPIMKTVQYLDQMQKYNLTKKIILDGDISMLIQLEGEGSEEETGRLRGFTRTSLFSNTVSTFILVNALTLSIETDHGDPTGAILVIENICCFVFAVEMVAKLIEDDLKYFQDKRNVFDFILAWYTILDMWVARNGKINLSFLRMLRVLRIARLVKVLRIFRELWLILVGMAQSMKVIMWSSLLMFFVTFAASIVATQLIGRETPNYGFSTDEAELEELALEWNNYEYFGTIPRSMVTLFNMGTGLEWLEIIRPLQEKQPYLIPLFIMYLALISWGIMNAIIGVIVEGMMQVVKQSDAERKNAERKRKERLLDSLIQKAISIDWDKDGEIDRMEMLGMVNDPEFQDILGSMRIFRSPEDFIALFDRGEDTSGIGKLTYQEFVRGMYNWIEDPGDWKFCELKIGESNLKAMLRREFNTLHKRLDDVNAQQQMMKPDMGKELQTAKQSPLVAPPSDCNKLPVSHWGSALASISQTLAALQGSIDGLNANVDGLRNDTVDMKKDIVGLKHNFNYLAEKAKKGKDKTPRAAKENEEVPLVQALDDGGLLSEPAPQMYIQLS